jgi:hypothetical protein
LPNDSLFNGLPFDPQTKARSPVGPTRNALHLFPALIETRRGEGMSAKEDHQTSGGLSCSRVPRPTARRTRLIIQPQDRNRRVFDRHQEHASSVGIELMTWRAEINASSFCHAERLELSRD